MQNSVTNPLYSQGPAVVAANSHLLVFGDLMLDRTVSGAVEGTSPEAPVPMLKVASVESRPGGAAAVARLLRGLELGIDVCLAGVVGLDAPGQSLRTILRQQGIHENGILEDASRLTTVKERFVGQALGRHAQQVLRVDYETVEPLAHDVAEQLWERVAAQLPECDAVLISDYSKGVCTSDLVPRLIIACQWQGIPVIVDPGRQTDPLLFSGADLIKPNRTWVEHVLGCRIDDESSARAALGRLREKFGWKAERLLLTLDRDGMLLDEPGHAPIHFPARIRSIYDVTGAGDLVQAVVGACLAGGSRLSDAVRIAVSAAGLEVERFGVAPVAWREIVAEQARRTPAVNKLLSRTAVAAFGNDLRRRGQTIVFTNGCFDLLHAGHVRLLQQAAELGDCLVVGINSDESVRRLKGDERPLIPQDQRSSLLAALECVDAVVVFEDDTPVPLLRELRPDVLVKGDEYASHQVVGAEVVLGFGGRIATVPMVPGLSTTNLLRSCANRMAVPSGSRDQQKAAQHATLTHEDQSH